MFNGDESSAARDEIRHFGKAQHVSVLHGGSEAPVRTNQVEPNADEGDSLVRPIGNHDPEFRRERRQIGRRPDFNPLDLAWVYFHRFLNRQKFLLLQERANRTGRLTKPVLIFNQRESNKPFTHRPEADSRRYRDQGLFHHRLGEFK